MRSPYEWDVFLSYAHEDREAALRLRDALTQQDLRVWIDDNLEIGDRLTEQINAALQSSRFGVVLVSPASLRKPWTIRELGVLLARESQGQKVVLPVLHNVTAEEASRQSSDLGNRFGLSTDIGFEALAVKIAAVVHKDRRGVEIHVRAPEKVVGFVSGSLALGVAVWLVFRNQSLTQPQFLAFAVLLALGAAGYSPILPGNLTLKSRRLIQATSSLAVFVLVILFAPKFVPSTTNEKTPPANKQPEHKVEPALPQSDSSNPPVTNDTSANGITTGGLADMRPPPAHDSPGSGSTNKKTPPPVSKENPADLSRWSDVSETTPVSPRPHVLQAAYCTMSLVFNGTTGTVMPVPKEQGLTDRDLHRELWLVKNDDNTVSFVTRNEQWYLAAAGTGLSMEQKTGTATPDKVKFRLRLQQNPNSGSAQNYSAGCNNVAIARKDSAYLLEPVSNPNQVFTWESSSFRLTRPPPAHPDPDVAFETKSIFLLAFPQPTTPAVSPSDGVSNSTSGSFYDSQYSSIRTNELALARAGEAAFNRGDYEWSLKFLQQAKAVSSSGVWQYAYPFWAGDLFMLNRETEATQVLNQMLFAIDAKQGYLSHQTPLGMILTNLGTVKGKVPHANQSTIDSAIDHVTAVKSSLPD